MRRHWSRARQNVLAVAGLWASVAVAVREMRARQDALVDIGESAAALTLQHFLAGAALTDANGTVYSANPTLARWCAATPEAMIGRPLSDLVHPGDADALAAALAPGPAARCGVEVRLLGAAQDHWVRLLVAHLPATASRPALCVVAVEDVAERRAATERLVHDALHDLLTGLANRRAITAALEELVASRVGEAVLVMVDLDEFKAVNDRLGHDAGDELLRVVAERLRGCLRPGDVAGRWGGDELVIIAAGISDDAGAEAVGRRVLEALVGPVSLSAGAVGLRASIGLRRITAGDHGGAAVIRDADAALYRAKRAGGCRVRLAGAGEGAAIVAPHAPLIPDVADA